MLLTIILLAACSSPPPQPDPPLSATPAQSTALTNVVDIAQSLVGKPYRYGGHNPNGFDCSGLVYYSFGRIGIKVPRTTSAQMKTAQSVNLNSIRPGDILFFKLGWKKVSHVGIYVGDNRFIHAPSSGKAVMESSLDEEYWQRRVVRAGRFW